MINIQTKEKKISRPQGLNTVNFLKVASNNLQIGPHRVLNIYKAMQIAEHLYLSGYVTYPRTESSSYPKNFDFKYICK